MVARQLVGETCSRLVLASSGADNLSRDAAVRAVFRCGLTLSRAAQGLPIVRRGRAALPVERGVTDNHGRGQRRSMATPAGCFQVLTRSMAASSSARRIASITTTSVAGIPFDPADPTSWGIGGKAPADRSLHPRQRTQPDIRGPGGFKTTAAVSTALTWSGSNVILDPSTELGPMLDAALRRQREQIVTSASPMRIAASLMSPASMSSAGSISPIPRPNSCPQRRVVDLRRGRQRRGRPGQGAAKVLRPDGQGARHLFAHALGLVRSPNDRHQPGNLCRRDRRFRRGITPPPRKHPHLEPQPDGAPPCCGGR